MTKAEAIDILLTDAKPKIIFKWDFLTAFTPQASIPIVGELQAAALTSLTGVVSKHFHSKAEDDESALINAATQLTMLDPSQKAESIDYYFEQDSEGTVLMGMESNVFPKLSMPAIPL